MGTSMAEVHRDEVGLDYPSCGVGPCCNGHLGAMVGSLAEKTGVEMSVLASVGWV
jgi:hypothetical protein